MNNPMQSTLTQDEQALVAAFRGMNAEAKRNALYIAQGFAENYPQKQPNLRLVSGGKQ